MKKLIFALLLVAGPAWGQSLTFMNPVTTQSLAITSSSTQITTSLGAHVRVVRLHPTEDAHVAFGSSPAAGSSIVATTADLLIPADTTEYFLVSPNGFIAVIEDSSNALGIIYVTGMTR